MEKMNCDNGNLNLKAKNILKKASYLVPGLVDIAKQIKSPSDLDSICASLDLHPCLANFSLATVSETPLGRGLHIPVQISSLEGGRKSLYFLDPGEETLAGMYVIGEKIFKRYVRRESGDGIPARTGDIYTERITTLEGITVEEITGSVEIWDPGLGIGALITDEPEPRVWVVWSCIKV
ncbi:hypothetical protein [Bacillus toyonensis]|uniref:hypothetical protein n=1 Tax=Bacillus toyonensis TaxID=155322 RepID=UPI000BEBCF66|nr:hypothetical protein [Bacillus toyonensis]PEE81746.1 hypothetical protein COO15_15945 [Bacillus toyonensis]